MTDTSHARNPRFHETPTSRVPSAANARSDRSVAPAASVPRRRRSRRRARRLLPTSSRRRGSGLPGGRPATSRRRAPSRARRARSPRPRRPPRPSRRGRGAGRRPRARPGASSRPTRAARLSPGQRRGPPPAARSHDCTSPSLSASQRRPPPTRSARGSTRSGVSHDRDLVALAPDGSSRLLGEERRFEPPCRRRLRLLGRHVRRPAGLALRDLERPRGREPRGVGAPFGEERTRELRVRLGETRARGGGLGLRAAGHHALGLARAFRLEVAVVEEERGGGREAATTTSAIAPARRKPLRRAETSRSRRASSRCSTARRRSGAVRSADAPEARRAVERGERAVGGPQRRGRRRLRSERERGVHLEERLADAALLLATRLPAADAVGELAGARGPLRRVARERLRAEVGERARHGLVHLARRAAGRFGAAPRANSGRSEDGNGSRPVRISKRIAPRP